MRILFLVMWLLIPVGAVAYHLGPGQEQVKLDQASQILVDADELIKDQQWAEAQAAVEKALALVPAEKDQLRLKLQLQRARIQMNNSQLPEANQDLESIVTSFADGKANNSELEKEARLALANSQYYMTWLKRLEGRSRDEWEPDVLAAQQNLRLLAERAANTDNDSEAARFKKDLEATVKLARLDLGQLQGLPLPSQ